MKTLVTTFSTLVVIASVAGPARLARAEPRLGDPVPPDAVRTVVNLEATVIPIEMASAPIDSDIRDTAVTQESATSTEIHLSLSADVLFDFDHAELKPESAPAIAKVLSAMQGMNGGRVSVLVEGHTDAVGADDYNRALSVRRAESVRGALAKRAGSAATFSVGGWGSAKPVSPNRKPDGSDDPQGRARNRRVEIVVRAI